MMIHDCGYGISVFFMKSPPREKEIERIRDIYSVEYVDEELQELIPAEANLLLKK